MKTHLIKNNQIGIRSKMVSEKCDFSFKKELSDYFLMEKRDTSNLWIAVKPKLSGAYIFIFKNDIRPKNFGIITRRLQILSTQPILWQTNCKR